MSRGKIVMTFAPMIRNEGEHSALLRASGYTIAAAASDTPLTAAQMLPLVGDAVAVIAGGEHIDASVIAAAPRLRVISRHGVGYDNVDVDAATRARVAVTITPGTNHVAVAELAMAMMIALARRIVPMREALLRGDWPRMPGIELAGKTLGVVGMGRIGKALATRARAFDMTVIACDVAPDHAFAAQHDVRLVALDALLRDADFVSLHAPATRDRSSLVGARELALMKRDAFLVNTARGSLVDERALTAALSEGRIAGAALDVFAQEPPSGSTLPALPNVLATPHIGGTREAGMRTALLAARNALQVLAGERCPHTVNPEVYA
jgi:D-3-phosphoglycerate dehydrogenase